MYADIPESILHVCVEQNHYDELEFLLQNSSRASMPNDRLRIVLSKAVETTTQNEGIIYMNLTERQDSLLFLDDGVPDVDPNMELLSETPLHIAAFLGRKECFEILLMYGASLDCVNHHGETPLHLAVIHGRNDIISILLLRKKFKSFLQQSGTTKQNALHLACLCGKNDVIKNIVNHLQEQAPEILMQMFDQIDQNGEYPIHIVSRKGDVGIMELMLHADQQAYKRLDEEKRTILHIATMHGNTDMVRLMLSMNTSIVNEQDSSGWTPLHISSMLRHQDIDKLLLQAGASPEIQNARKLTPHQFSTLDALEVQMENFLKEIGGNLEDMESEINEQLSNL